jgi:hypothetical protein
MYKHLVLITAISILEELYSMQYEIYRKTLREHTRLEDNVWFLQRGDI